MSGKARPARGVRPQAILVGGSAGAFDVSSRLVSSLPAGYATPVVVVLHQPRQRAGGGLATALQWRCALSVREPEDKEPLAPAKVYVAPANYHLLIDEGPSFALSVDEPVNFSRPSIDVLFESAADVLGARCAAVLLSGANADGARGLRAVADAGGEIVVQDPRDAPQVAMPRAALALCPEACVLPAAGIVEWMRSVK